MNIDFSKGLVPAIVQDYQTRQVLMLGYMNEEALRITQSTGEVTFFSRSRETIWTKGETSGNKLLLKSLQADCDNDTILIQAAPMGPTCHKGTASCFGEGNAKGFIYQLEGTIDQRVSEGNGESYTKSLVEKGMEKVAQKVGEEATEVVIEALGKNDEAFKNEAADLLYHFLVMLRAKQVKFSDIEEVLQNRVR